MNISALSLSISQVPFVISDSTSDISLEAVLPICERAIFVRDDVNLENDVFPFVVAILAQSNQYVIY